MQSQQEVQRKEILGHGSTAQVFRAIFNNDEVAIKDFFVQTSKNEIQKEIDNLLLFNNQNIISILSSNVDQKWIIMPLCKKTTLFELLFQQNITHQLCRTIIGQIINGLEEIHAKGYAHRDLKLENVCLGKDGFLKIADLGKLTKIEEGVLVRRNEGTSYYMAHELFLQPTKMEASELSPTDVYSLGVIIFALVTKSFPYNDPNQDPFNKRLLFIRTNKWDSFWSSIRGRQFDEDFKILIENTLQNDPQLRWTLDQVKESTWMQRQQSSFDELTQIINLCS